MSARTAALGLAALAVLALVLAFTYRVLAPEREPLQAAPDPECDLAVAPCGAQLPGGGRVRLAITPRPIPVMERIRIEVDADGVNVEAVEIAFTGVDADMGENRYRLTGAGAGRFGGHATLPIGERARLRWQATVRLTVGGRVTAVPFRFESVPPQRTR